MRIGTMRGKLKLATGAGGYGEIAEIYIPNVLVIHQVGRSWDTKEAIVFTGRDLPGYKNWTPSAPLDQGNWPDAKVAIPLKKMGKRV
uniref:Uncharacterized protein n=3 Tax=Oryza TaxID=4527 RepID=A0A0D3F7S1_9ORYZ